MSLFITLGQRHFPWIIFGYCAAVLLIDGLAFNGPFRRELAMFRWLQPNGLDPFKLLFWLVIPLLLFGRRLNWAYLQPGRISRRQWLAFSLVLVLTFFAAWSITLFDVLERYYVRTLFDPWRYLTFLGSWFFGWEFLNRFLLLTVWDRWGPGRWWIVPIVETAYHVVKPWPEMLGMAVFSIFLCLWVKRTGSILFPILFHLAVELGLLVFLVGQSR